MADNAFENSACPIESVAPIPCENLLYDPTVPDPPEPIKDCPPDVPPLPPEPPCPTIVVDEVSLTLGGTTYVANEDTPAVPGQPHAVLTVTRGNCCDFEIDLDIEIPCLELTPSDPVTVPFAGGSITYGFSRAAGTCDYALDIDVESATAGCPVILPITPTVVPIDFVMGTSGELTYQVVKDPVECEFTLTLAATAPALDMQPQTPTTVNLYTAGGVPGYVTYQFTRTSVTQYELEIDALVPCPYVGPDVQVDDTVPFAADNADVGALSFIVTRDGLNCDYTLDIEVTCPCPVFHPLDEAGFPDGHEYVYGYTAGGVDAYVSWWFTREPGCEYTLHIDFVLPCPVQRPLDWAYWIYRPGEEGHTDIVEPDDPYEGYVRWRFVKGAPAEGETPADPEACEYTLEVELQTPPADCDYCHDKLCVDDSLAGLVRYLSVDGSYVAVPVCGVRWYCAEYNPGTMLYAKPLGCYQFPVAAPPSGLPGWTEQSGPYLTEEECEEECMRTSDSPPAAGCPCGGVLPLMFDMAHTGDLAPIGTITAVWQPENQRWVAGDGTTEILIYCYDNVSLEIFYTAVPGSIDPPPGNYLVIVGDVNRPLVCDPFSFYFETTAPDGTVTGSAI